MSLLAKAGCSLFFTTTVGGTALGVSLKSNSQGVVVTRQQRESVTLSSSVVSGTLPIQEFENPSVSVDPAPKVSMPPSQPVPATQAKTEPEQTLPSVSSSSLPEVSVEQHQQDALQAQEEIPAPSELEETSIKEDQTRNTLEDSLDRLETPLQEEVATREEQMKASLEEQPVEEEPDSNCQIIDPVEETFKSLDKDQKDYYLISCENKGNDTFQDRWQGLFPKALFAENNQFTLNKKFEMSVKTDMEEDEENIDWSTFSEEDPNMYGITMYISKFSESEITGRWNYGDVGEESDVAVINLTSFLRDGKIYLFDFKSNTED